jgi:hypothetical protein
MSQAVVELVPQLHHRVWEDLARWIRTLLIGIQLRRSAWRTIDLTMGEGLELRMKLWGPEAQAEYLFSLHSMKLVGPIDPVTRKLIDGAATEQEEGDAGWPGEAP